MQTLSLIVYNISIRLYVLGIRIFSLFDSKAKLWVEGRKIKPDYGKIGAGKRVWFHCASLGEFEQARPVIELIKKERPDTRIILSFFSPSGFEIRKNYELADLVLYLPADTANNAKEFIAQIKPNVALFVKYEFWYHILTQLKQQNIPTILFSSVFRKDQIFFQWYGSFFSQMLLSFDKIFVQNEESNQLLNQVGVLSEVAFDTRFDRVFQIAQQAKAFSAIEKFKGTSKIFIAGSTWPLDDKLISQIIADNKLPGYKFIIAPHDLTETKISELVSSLKNAKRLSELNEASADSTQVVIVDSMGKLSSLYAYGNIGYIGGGFDASVHNVLEAAVYGMPLMYGPNHTKSVEAIELISTGAAFSISGYADILKVLQQLTRCETNSYAQISSKYVKDRLNGSKAIYNYINGLF